MKISEIQLNNVEAIKTMIDELIEAMPQEEVQRRYQEYAKTKLKPIGINSYKRVFLRFTVLDLLLQHKYYGFIIKTFTPKEISMVLGMSRRTFEKLVLDVTSKLRCEFKKAGLYSQEVFDMLVPPEIEAETKDAIEFHNLYEKQ